MKIVEVVPLPEGALRVVTADGRSGVMDVRPYFESAAFGPLKNPEVFAKVRNGGYFVAWDCGADLSADTIEARWVTMPPEGAQQEHSARL